MGNFDYKAIIIGSGQSGKPLAVDLANQGWKTAIIENHLLGGSCINYGCTPTKTMVSSARVAYLVKSSEKWGVNTGSIEVDFRKVRERKRDVVNSFRKGIKKSIEDTDNLDLIRGTASLAGKNQINIDLKDGGNKSISAQYIFINTGTRAMIPPIEGINDIEYHDSESIMEIDSLPDHLVIIGGGYVGLEFGQMFKRFGSDVTIIQRDKQLLPREDEDIAGEILKILQDEGVDIYLSSEAKKVAKKNSNLVLDVDTPEGNKTITGSHLLLAAGRTVNSDMLNLDSAGIEYDKRGYIKTDDHLRTSAENIYALGDIKGGPAFTHISYDDYRVVKNNLLENGDKSIARRLIPYTVFIDPQLGRVGLSEKEANQNGIDYRLAKMPMKYVARAIEVGQTRGFIKALVDKQDGHILGCAVLGFEGGEMMNMLQIAMMGGLKYTDLRDTAFSHPTLGESLNNLFMSLD